MKTSSKRFTLIELLVVIAIIGILAGLVFPALGVVRNNAKKSKASSECQSLKTAIIMYESEFSCWPMSVSSDTTSLSSSEYVKMCKFLTCYDDSMQNSKKMVFFEAGTSYDPDDGILDPWGNQYQVIVDHDFNGKISASATSDVGKINKYKSSNSKDTLVVRVAVYSFGDKSEKKTVSEKTSDLKGKLDTLAKKGKVVTSW